MYDNIGFENGRLILGLPEMSIWVSEVKENISTDPQVNRKEMEILLNHLVKQGFSKIIPNIDDRKDWYNNARDLLMSGKIRGIISDHDTDFISPAVLSRVYPEWNVPRDVYIKRSYSEFFSVIAPIVRHAKRIKIIDPYFDIMEERFYKFLRICSDSASNSWQTNIEVHIDHRSCRSYARVDFEKDWREIREKEISRRPNVNIQILAWSEMSNGLRIHDRYLVTENGGIRIPRGTDIVGGSDYADISLLSNTMAVQIYSNYPSNGNSTQLRLISSHRI
ncbi:hypothetical protein [Deinococcus ruber]|uniref:hypothetical protein n=1 Tax=Deinococcus ruber TaxID=1848197 RepID=UPI0016662F74|nr:hypothetical protein [Deinococcus ruber]